MHDPLHSQLPPSSGRHPHRISPRRHHSFPYASPRLPHDIAPQDNANGSHELGLVNHIQHIHGFSKRSKPNPAIEPLFTPNPNIPPALPPHLHVTSPTLRSTKKDRSAISKQRARSTSRATSSPIVPSYAPVDTHPFSQRRLPNSCAKPKTHHKKSSGAVSASPTKSRHGKDENEKERLADTGEKAELINDTDDDDERGFVFPADYIRQTAELFESEVLPAYSYGSKFQIARSQGSGAGDLVPIAVGDPGGAAAVAGDCESSGGGKMTVVEEGKSQRGSGEFGCACTNHNHSQIQIQSQCQSQGQSQSLSSVKTDPAGTTVLGKLRTSTATPQHSLPLREPPSQPGPAFYIMPDLDVDVDIDLSASPSPIEVYDATRDPFEPYDLKQTPYRMGAGATVDSMTYGVSQGFKLDGGASNPMLANAGCGGTGNMNGCAEAGAAPGPGPIPEYPMLQMDQAYPSHLTGFSHPSLPPQLHHNPNSGAAAPYFYVDNQSWQDDGLAVSIGMGMDVKMDSDMDLRMALPMPMSMWMDTDAAAAGDLTCATVTQGFGGFGNKANWNPPVPVVGGLSQLFIAGGPGLNSGYGGNGSIPDFGAFSARGGAGTGGSSSSSSTSSIASLSSGSSTSSLSGWAG